jgi:hypothetical protein
MTSAFYDICKNKARDTCLSKTGALNINQQKYGNYHYCSGCVNAKTRDNIKKIYVEELVKLGYFTSSVCCDCKKALLKKDAIISFKKTCTLPSLITVQNANDNIDIFCKKCSEKKKNIILPYPHITDVLIEATDVFKMETTDSDTATDSKDLDSHLDSHSDSHPDILGIYSNPLDTLANTLANQQKNIYGALASIGTQPKRQDIFDAMYTSTSASTPIKKQHVDQVTATRIANLSEKLTKMNLAYLLCLVCSDEEIYNRVISQCDS